MHNKIYVSLLILFCCFGLMTSVLAQSSEETKEEKSEIQQLREQIANLRHQFDRTNKAIDDIVWYHNVGDVAHVDKVRMTGPPKWKEKNPTAQGAGNPVRFYAYIFIPKNIDYGKKYPLLVFPHGGVHSNFGSGYTHIVRELIAQGYIIVAADYRGSTGYGSGMYESIDYGGREVEDVYASRNFMVENYPFVDKDRVGILGWSHGGLITLMNIFNHPNDYKVAYAGVPVSDLVARMGYKSQRYRDLYSAEYHIGKSADNDVEEYKKRSPAWNAEKLQTPLLIHTNTNDEDVNVLEVQHLIKSLKAAGKKFEYEVFDDIPGGHAFDRLDVMQAKETRLKIYKFLAQYLNPPKPFNSAEDVFKAGYRQ